MFGDHIVAVGFVICFSPYQLEIILSLVFVILRFLYEIRLHRYNSQLKFIKTCTHG